MVFLSIILNFIFVKFFWYVDRNFKLKKYWLFLDLEVFVVSEGF